MRKKRTMLLVIGVLTVALSLLSGVSGRDDADTLTPPEKTNSANDRQITGKAVIADATVLLFSETAVPAAFEQMTGKLENTDASEFTPDETADPASSEQIPDADAAAGDEMDAEMDEADGEDEETVEVLAKLVYGEAGSCSTTEQAAVVWCVLNRVDAGGGDIITVATASNQFYGYRPSNPVSPDIEALVRDVLARWQAEDCCIGSVGRVLPAEYLWFGGDGQHNYFRSAYKGGTQWDWSLPSPYEGE